MLQHHCSLPLQGQVSVILTTTWEVVRLWGVGQQGAGGWVKFAQERCMRRGARAWASAPACIAAHAPMQAHACTHAAMRHACGMMHANRHAWRTSMSGLHTVVRGSSIGGQGPGAFLTTVGRHSTAKQRPQMPL